MLTGLDSREIPTVINQNTQEQPRTGLSNLIAIVIAACFICLSAIGFAGAAEPVSKTENGIAIGSHDAVAYHSLSREPHAAALPGAKTWTVEYKGAQWNFASKENADLFQANPEKYKPAYNGHCANALSLGRGLVVTDGTVWEIFGDQLFLFFAERGRERWLSTDDISAFKAVSDAEWQKLSQ